MTMQTFFPLLPSLSLFSAVSDMLRQIELIAFTYMPEGIKIFTENIPFHWHTCTQRHKDTRPFTALHGKKSGYMWGIRPVSLIIHPVGGGVRWQTAYLLSDRHGTSVVSPCCCTRTFSCMCVCVCEWETGRKRELSKWLGQVMRLRRQQRRRRCPVSCRGEENGRTTLPPIQHGARY